MHHFTIIHVIIAVSDLDVIPAIFSEKIEIDVTEGDWQRVDFNSVGKDFCNRCISTFSTINFVKLPNDVKNMDFHFHRYGNYVFLDEVFYPVVVIPSGLNSQKIHTDLNQKVIKTIYLNSVQLKLEIVSFFSNFMCIWLTVNDNDKVLGVVAYDRAD